MTDVMLQKLGKYEILERIGRGGMGTIFRARDPVLDRLVALKVISTDGGVSDDLRARFFREGKACAQLSHPNIVTVYSMGDEDGRLFIVMELLDGEDLKRLLGRPTELALPDKLAIIMQVCDGLHYAHSKGIVHRDIKPGNIFVQSRGPVKILDFGIAHVATAESILTRSGLVMGSLRYMSPEQARGRVDHRSDIFSLGAVFYELLGQRPPFVSDDPMQLLELLRTKDPTPLDEVSPAIPRELAGIVARAMRKDPAERFADLGQMRAELQEVRDALAADGRRLRARTASPSGASPAAASPDADPSATEIGRINSRLWEAPAAPEPRPRRRVGRAVAAAAGGLVLLALGAVLWPWAVPRTGSHVPSPAKPTESAVPRPEARVEATSESPPATAVPAPPASPEMNRPLTAREALRDAYDRRDPAHSVIAAMPQGALRIGRDSLRFTITSSRPGYLYVLVIRSKGSNAELLFPNAADGDNRVEAGQPATLPGDRWPLRASPPAGSSEFLAIVSDEPRDFGALEPVAGSISRRVRLDRDAGPAPARSSPLLAGAVVCKAAACSESYGAVVFSIDSVRAEPEIVQVPRRPPAPAALSASAPSEPAPRKASPRCSNLLERASLGEPLTDEEKTVLTRDCH